MKKKFLITIVVAGATLWTACNSGEMRRDPGRVYAPDMTYSQAYDAYTENPVTANGLTSQLPVPGTIARDHALPRHIDEDDTAAYYALTFPEQFSAEEIDEGQRLYEIHCAICHGTELDGNGPLYKSGKFAAMPANFLGGDLYKHMPPGRMYHAIMFGKNMMGSYSSQLNERERWQVIAFIKRYQSENGGDPFAMGSESEEGTDSTATATADAPEAAGTQADSTQAAEAHN